MAEVTKCSGRRVRDISLNIYKRYLLESRSKHRKRILNTSSLSVGFLLDDIQFYELKEAENGANRVYVGSQVSYTRVKHLNRVFGPGLDKGNVTENISKKTPIKLNERNLPRYRNVLLFPRTLLSSSSLQQTSNSRYLYPEHGNLILMRKYHDTAPRSEPLYKTKTGYYEVLEVTPSATQAQIKTAYYKQSFLYHPDRNAGSDEATVRFSEISEAYLVLGNKGLRKKYDRGLLNLSDLTATVRSPGDTTGSSAKQQAAGRRSVVGSDSRGGVFDFDKFFKSHYSGQLQRQRDIKVRKEEMLKKQQDTVEDRKLGRMMEVGVGMLLAFAMGILLSLKR